MKQQAGNKTYETIFKALQALLYCAIAAIAVAYIVFLIIGQEKPVLANVEIVLMFAVVSLWQADILIRKKLYTSGNADKQDKKHTVAVFVALVSSALCAVFFALLKFCRFSGAIRLSLIVITILAILATSAALAVGYSLTRGAKTENSDRNGQERR